MNDDNEPDLLLPKTPFYADFNMDPASALDTGDYSTGSLQVWQEGLAGGASVSVQVWQSNVRAEEGFSTVAMAAAVATTSATFSGAGSNVGFSFTQRYLRLGIQPAFGTSSTEQVNVEAVLHLTKQ